MQPEGHPEFGEERNGSACVAWEGVDRFCCLWQLPVHVTHCGGFLVYHLKRTEECSMAYCAKEGNNWQVLLNSNTSCGNQFLCSPLSVIQSINQSMINQWKWNLNILRIRCLTGCWPFAKLTDFNYLRLLAGRIPCGPGKIGYAPRCKGMNDGDSVNTTLDDTPRQSKAFLYDFIIWSYHLHLNINVKKLISWLFGQGVPVLPSLITTPQQKRIHDPTSYFQF